jgi:hypothetical protein
MKGLAMRGMAKSLAIGRASRAFVGFANHHPSVTLDFLKREEEYVLTAVSAAGESLTLLKAAQLRELTDGYTDFVSIVSLASTVFSLGFKWALSSEGRSYRVALEEFCKLPVQVGQAVSINPRGQWDAKNSTENL